LTFPVITITRKRIKVETNVENNKRSAKAIYLNESLNAVPIVDHRKVAAMA
jgi:hypothetical protein